MRVLGDRAGVDLALHALEHGAHLPRRHAVHAGFRGPLIEHEVGGAQHDHPVHRGRSPHGIALHQRDRRIVGGAEPALGIQLLGELGLAFIEVGARAVRPRFQHHHLEAGFGQSGRRDRAAGTGADHHHIGGPMPVVAHGDRRNHPARQRGGRDVRGQHHGTTRHRLVGPTDPGQRSFPRHLRRPQVQRARVTDRLGDLRARIVHRQNQAAYGMRGRSERGQRRVEPAAEAPALLRRIERAEATGRGNRQQHRDPSPQHIEGETELGTTVRRQRRQTRIASRHEVGARFGARGGAVEDAGNERIQRGALRRRQVRQNDAGRRADFGTHGSCVSHTVYAIARAVRSPARAGWVTAITP